MCCNQRYVGLLYVTKRAIANKCSIATITCTLRSIAERKAGMYQVISRNVIRAALRWHNMPPARIVLLSSDRLVTGVMTCDYEVVFSQDAAERRTHLERLKGDGQHWRCFNDIVKECFCGDITIFKRQVDGASGTVRYYLHCRLEPWELQADKGNASRMRTRRG